MAIGREFFNPVELILFSTGTGRVVVVTVVVAVVAVVVAVVVVVVAVVVVVVGDDVSLEVLGLLVACPAAREGTGLDVYVAGSSREMLLGKLEKSV